MFHVLDVTEFELSARHCSSFSEVADLILAKGALVHRYRVFS